MTIRFDAYTDRWIYIADAIPTGTADTLYERMRHNVELREVWVRNNLRYLNDEADYGFPRPFLDQAYEQYRGHRTALASMPMHGVYYNDAYDDVFLMVMAHFHPQSEQYAYTMRLKYATLLEDYNYAINTNEDDMTETIEVELTKGTNDSIVASLKMQLDMLAKESAVKEQLLNECTEAKFPDKTQRAAIKSVWEKQAQNSQANLKVCDGLVTKFESAKRPFKLQKNERSLLTKIIDSVKIELQVFAGGSSIKDIAHPDRFYGYPSLQRTVASKIAHAHNQIKNLTRSDVNVSVK